MNLLLLLSLCLTSRAAVLREIPFVLAPTSPSSLVSLAIAADRLPSDRVYGEIPRTDGGEKTWIVEQRKSENAFDVDFATERAILVQCDIRPQHDTMAKMWISDREFLAVVPRDAVSDFRSRWEDCQVVLISAEPIAVLDEELYAGNVLVTKQPSLAIQDALLHLNNSRDIYRFATYLTGEDTASPITTRQSYSPSGRVAATWIYEQFQSWGFNVSYFYYQPKSDGTNPYNPNVVAEWPDSGLDGSEELFIVGAHYDDRQRNMYSTTDTAPGANDDGSGTAMILQLGKWISETKQRFRKRVRIIAFSGEEQGLYGSAAYAKFAKQQSVKIIGMIQGDMLGYNWKQGKSVGLSFVKGYTTPVMTSVVEQLTRLYVPELEITDTNACCSDHQSFYSVGYPAVGFVEPKGYRVDPEYHHPGDLVNRPGYDVEQILMITKAIGACLLELAGYQFGE